MSITITKMKTGYGFDLIVDEDKKYESVFMAVSIDEYELPLFVALTKQEMCDWSGMTMTALNTALYDKRARGKGSTRGFNLVAVRLEHGESDE